VRRSWWAPTTATVGTAGLIMRRVDGETIARRILRDRAYRRAREVLGRPTLGAFAAGLHALDPPAGLPAPDPVADRGQP